MTGKDQTKNSAVGSKEKKEKNMSAVKTAVKAKTNKSTLSIEEGSAKKKTPVCKAAKKVTSGDATEAVAMPKKIKAVIKKSKLSGPAAEVLPAKAEKSTARTASEARVVPGKEASAPHSAPAKAPIVAQGVNTSVAAAKPIERRPEIFRAAPPSKIVVWQRPIPDPVIPPVPPVSTGVNPTDSQKTPNVSAALSGAVTAPQDEASILAPEALVAEQPKMKVMEFETPLSLKDLATTIGTRANELIIYLMTKKMLVTINQSLGEDVVRDILKERGIEYRKPAKTDDAISQISAEHREHEAKHDASHAVPRPPVVTFMGHVDHGKTSLLDFIRKTRVADREKGGITQHIGAYEVRFKNGSVTFLDTPGHEAFTAMRARGANATDVVVLVVAADDGVMPQTKEALDHARAAGVTIVVALNKCDLPSANVDKVKGQLSQIDLTPEDWGGKTITVQVSAKTGEGVDQLLEMLLLESELLELKANPKLRARGVVIEGKLSSGQGPVATVLVKNGTLHLGDMMVSGVHYGRVKAMINDKGERVLEAGPSKPVSILGLAGVPMAGDEFFVVKDEKKARTLTVLKQDEARVSKLRLSKRVTLEDFYKSVKEGNVKELGVVIKGDVQGSVEAIQASLRSLDSKDIRLNIIHADVGNVNESDVMLAMVSNAVILGFNVRIDEKAQAIASKEGIEIKMYGIIYEALADVKAAMEGLLEPFLKEVFVGRAQVKQVFKLSKAGTIGGCMVLKGKIVRTGIAKLIRDKIVVYEGKIASLKRLKDDAREVQEGFECGIGLDRHNDIKASDLIEIYQIEKVARRLESRR